AKSAAKISSPRNSPSKDRNSALDCLQILASEPRFDRVFARFGAGLFTLGFRMKRVVDIGVLLSRSGMYTALACASRAGVLRGVEEVNVDPNLDVAFRVIERDPEGRADRYAPLCREILKGSNARHIFG